MRAAGLDQTGEHHPLPRLCNWPVVVEGLDAALEWNGKRGLVGSYGAAEGRYQLLVKGRTNQKTRRTHWG